MLNPPPEVNNELAARARQGEGAEFSMTRASAAAYPAMVNVGMKPPTERF
jgi:hypothetical protein